LAAGEVVAGTADVLGGSVNISNPPSTAPTGTTIIPIVQGGAGSVITQLPVTGVNNSLLLQFSTKADNVNHQLDLVITSEAASSFSTQGNTVGIANALDAIINSGDHVNGTLQSIILQLEGFTTVAQLESALASLAPIVDDAVVHESERLQELTFDALSERLDGLNVKGYNGGDRRYGRGAWVKLLGQDAHQSERQGYAGYKDQTWGIVGGTDILLSDNNMVGIAGSWGRLNLNHNISSSKTTADNFQVSLYGNYYFDIPLYIRWFAGLGYNHYDTNRNVFFGNVYLNPQSNYHGWQSGAKIESGYVFGNGDFHYIPIVSLFYSHLGLKAYTETSAGTASQHYMGQGFNFLKGSAGLKAVYDFAINKSGIDLIQPEIHGFFFYDFGKDRMQVTSDFIGGGPSFQTLGFTPARCGLDVGASIDVFTYDTTVLTAQYDFELQENYHANSGFLRLRYEW